MKKIIFMAMLMLLVAGLFGGRSATPHPVYIELHNSQGKVPKAENLEVKCWLEHKPEEVLDLSNSNLLFPVKDVFLQIQCAGFSSWNAGDLLHVEITDNGSGEFIAMVIELTYENFQIFFDNHLSETVEE
jgi:hypothetical protein